MPKKQGKKMVEVARSFAYKYNAGNYQSQDFFCSQKAECTESEALETSARLHLFCKTQVIKDLNAWILEQNDPKVAKITPEEEYNRLYTPAKAGADPEEAKEALAHKAMDVREEKGHAVFRATNREGGKEIIIKEDLTPQ